MSLLLKYNGPAVDGGSMDVYQAAANMMAFSNFIVAAAQEVYGDEVKVTAKVTALKHSSFAVDLLFSIAGLSPLLLQVLPDARNLVGMVRDAFDIRKHLQGRPPERVEPVGDGTTTVTNHGGQVIIVNSQAFNLTMNGVAAAGMEQFVSRALGEPGVDTIGVSETTTSPPIVCVTKDEAPYFQRLPSPNNVIENVSRVALVLVTPSFKEGNKWRLTDGQTSSLYEIEDREFLSKIAAGEPFRKDDVLVCDVRTRQEFVSGALKMERSITRVIHHQAQLGESGQLFSDGTSP
ncbi:hypothetical protein OS176_09540 [Xanthomonadaceae bacterium XH05]|nr:hypothetical protein [Xanthomonadaceae bacterium XH05]